MIRPSIILAAALCLATSLAHAAGFQFIEIPASDRLQPLKGAVWYPCAQPASEVKLGPFVLSVAKDCPITGEKLPLIAISHGRSDNFLGHSDTAERLADAGFVVVAINHPGDNAMDKSRTDDFSVFVERPTDIKRVIDFALVQWSGAAIIDAGRVGIFGFSRGGYTALVAIGANPRFDKSLRLCEGKDSLTCDQVHKEELPELVHDPRIKAAVIADPVNVFFTGESLRNVTAPVQLWGSEHGGGGVTPESVAGLVNQLPTKPEFHLIPNSQHFDFLAPCSAELTKSVPEICTDEQGFDRAAFHQEFDAAVVAFFRKHLLGM
jgi:predicted dienelactone hydrolase